MEKPITTDKVQCQGCRVFKFNAIPLLITGVSKKLTRHVSRKWHAIKNNKY